MNNPYFTTVGSYMNPMNPQEQQGLNPVFQNIAQQQANQNMALQQGINLTNQAGMTTEGKQAGVGMDPMAMAMALRGNKPDGATSNFGARADMALNSQASPMLQNQVSQLGSSTSNPFSNYNMGTNGWGNYGE
jgi:hypothetical protein